MVNISEINILEAYETLSVEQTREEEGATREKNIVRGVTERGRRRKRKKYIERCGSVATTLGRVGGLLVGFGCDRARGKAEYHRYSLSAHETSVVISAD